MPLDITFCTNKECRRSATCHRAVTEKLKEQLGDHMISMMCPDGNGCTFFWPKSIPDTLKCVLREKCHRCKGCKRALFHGQDQHLFIENSEWNAREISNCPFFLGEK